MATSSGGPAAAGDRDPGGLVAYMLLTPFVAGLFGVEVAAHGEEAAAAAHGTPPLLWAARAVAFAIGCVAGWLLSGLVNRLLGVFFKGFNWVFDRAIDGYGAAVGMLLRVSRHRADGLRRADVPDLSGLRAVPVGFIPEQDKGYLVVNAQLPDGASLERIRGRCVARLTEIVSKTPGVAHTIGVPGYSILLSTNISNVGGMFVILEPFEERKGKPNLSGHGRRRRTCASSSPQIQEARGRRLRRAARRRPGQHRRLQAAGAGPRRMPGLAALQEAVDNVVAAGNSQPGLVGLFTSFRANQPQLFVDLDRTQAKMQGVSLNDIFETLQAYLGSAYVNDFTASEPQLAGQRAGRRRSIRLRAGGHRQAQGAQPRRARWCRWRRC